MSKILFAVQTRRSLYGRRFWISTVNLNFFFHFLSSMNSILYHNLHNGSTNFPNAMYYLNALFFHYWFYFCRTCFFFLFRSFFILFYSFRFTFIHLIRLDIPTDNFFFRFMICVCRWIFFRSSIFEHFEIFTDKNKIYIRERKWTIKATSSHPNSLLSNLYGSLKKPSRNKNVFEMTAKVMKTFCRQKWKKNKRWRNKLHLMDERAKKKKINTILYCTANRKQ